MTPCPDYKETLWLDVYKELDPDERPNWERHLEECKACQEERKQLLGMIQTVKEAVPSPGLSPEKARAISRSIKRETGNERGDMWWKKSLFSTPGRLIPTFATTCLLITALCWFSLKEFKKPASVQMASSGPVLTDQIISEDLDVIKNLDLLQEMEVLEKLVKCLDKKGNHPSIQRESKTNYGGAYV